ncbi:MAG: phosphocholine cytidylyltransferase family protein [Actinobacteria bacterium]|nr:phosphocholine cytidylyltransferase family protein [Actinomycetota bacterium]
MALQVVILAAGIGTRLGKPWPKPLTPLADGRSIIQQQLDNVEKVFRNEARVTIVVGFKMEMIMEAHPNACFIYNEVYDQTNTSKSLLKALRASHESGVLWLNGDVVFDSRVLDRVQSLMREEKSFICVNTSATSEEEIKYTVDADGNINSLSKQVKNALGEAVGINFISKYDKTAAITYLEECADNDYFERGLELAIEKAGMKLEPVDISDLFAIEVDFQADLKRANEGLA